MLRDPRVAATLTDDGRPPSVERVRGQLAAKITHWDRHGFGLWVARDRATGTVVGRGGLQHTFLPGVDEIEAAWTIAAERWGEGLATEIARASVRVAFEYLALPRIIAYTQDSNLASRRVMEKSGFEFDRNVQHAGTPARALHPASLLV